MDIKRLKQLAGMTQVVQKENTTVTEHATDVRMSQILDFKRLLKVFEAVDVKEVGDVVQYSFTEETKEKSKQKLKSFKETWVKVKAGELKIDEAAYVAPGIDHESYPEIDGLEGPFRYKNGRVLYYDPREGKYYDRKTDMYLDDEEAASLHEGDASLLEEMTDAQKKKREEIVKGMKKNVKDLKKRYGKNWKSVMYATATKQALSESEAVGQDTKTVVNEDHGSGFYIVVLNSDEEENEDWFEDKEDAEEELEKLEKKGVKAKIVADKKEEEEKEEKEEKEDKEEEKEEKSEKKDDEKKDDKEEKEEKDEDKKEKKVEESNNNFLQPVNDKDNPLNGRMGVDVERNSSVTIPSDVKSSLTGRIKELEDSIKLYNEKGYNDNGVKQNAIDALKKILDNLSTNDVEGLKKAQIFYTTLMSPIADLMPSTLVLFLTNPDNVKANWLERLTKGVK